MDNLWRPKLKANQGAEAWCYYTKSGKTADVYVFPQGHHGDAILVKVPCYPPKSRKKAEAL